LSEVRKVEIGNPDHLGGLTARRLTELRLTARRSDRGVRLPVSDSETLLLKIMIYEKLHPDSPPFPKLIAGAWRWHTVPAGTVETLIKTSLDAGINTFDHADIYGDHGNEKIFGDAIRKRPALRSQIRIVTKCGIKLVSSHRPDQHIKHYDTSKDYIISSAESSLAKLGVEKIDVLLIHRPDPLMNPAEVAAAFTLLKDQGKVLHFGVSNFTASQFDLLQSYLDFPLVTNQLEMSLFVPQLLFDGTIDHMMKHRVHPMAWSPLGGGKFLAGETEPSRRVLDGLVAFNQKYSTSSNQLLLAWLLKHPSGMFPVIGTTKPDRILESVRALEIPLERQDWFEMLRWVTGKDVA
jgi:predicted oxidoreductase